MNISVTSSAFAAIVAIVLATSVLSYYRHRPGASGLILLFFVNALWQLAAFPGRFKHAHISAPAYGIALFLPPLLLNFFANFLDDKALKRWGRISLLLTLFFSVVNLTPLTLTLFVRSLIIIYIVLSPLIVLPALRHKIFDQLRMDTKRRLFVYLYYGAIIALPCNIFELFPEQRVLSSFCHLVTTAYLYVIYRVFTAGFRTNAFDLFGKAIVTMIHTLILAFFYAFFVFWVESSQVDVWFVNTLAASFLVLIGFNQLKPWFEKKVLSWFFPRFKRLEPTVEKLQNSLNNHTWNHFEDFHKESLENFSEALGSLQASVYLLTPDETHYQCLTHKGDPTPDRFEHDNPIVQELYRSQEALIKDDLLNRLNAPQAQGAQSPTEQLIKVMDDCHCTLTVPLAAEHTLVGFYCFYALDFTTMDIDFLTSFQKQVAMRIMHERIFQQQLLRARFAKMGELSLGIMERIRTHLDALNTVLKDTTENIQDLNIARGKALGKAQEIADTLQMYQTLAVPGQLEKKSLALNNFLQGLVQASDKNWHLLPKIELQLTHDLDNISLHEESMQNGLQRIVEVIAKSVTNIHKIVVTTHKTHEIYDPVQAKTLRHLRHLHPALSIECFDAHDKGITFPHNLRNQLDFAIACKFIEDGGGRPEMQEIHGTMHRFIIHFDIKGP